MPNIVMGPEHIVVNQTDKGLALREPGEKKPMWLEDSGRQG